MRRREFMQVLAGTTLASAAAAQGQAPAQREGAMTNNATLERIRTKSLEIAYEESGPKGGTPVLLMHGFPYDVRAYDEVAPRLAAVGLRAIVPYLRGYGPTRFLSAEAVRSGQEAATR